MQEGDWLNFVDSFKGTSGLPGSIANLASGIATGAATGGPIGALVGGLQSGLQEGMNAISSIGKGRREADIIVPLQNQFGSVLVEANRLMQDSSMSARQLAGVYVTVVDGYSEFDAFTRDPKFVDGRASVQARNTIRPLVDGKNDMGQSVRSDGGTLGNLERAIIAKGGTAPGNVRNGGSPGDPSATDQAGGNSGALLIGGGAIVAKLLGFF